MTMTNDGPYLRTTHYVGRPCAYSKLLHTLSLLLSNIFHSSVTNIIRASSTSSPSTYPTCRNAFSPQDTYPALWYVASHRHTTYTHYPQHIYPPLNSCTPVTNAGGPRSRCPPHKSRHAYTCYFIFLALPCHQVPIKPTPLGHGQQVPS